MGKSSDLHTDYVLLTGAINNAGDFLIKKRAIRLLEYVRPERTLMDRNRWDPLTREEIEKINRGRALILCGGPAIKKTMVPHIYPLSPTTLEKIQVPIITMGLGWNHAKGDWWDTGLIRLSEDTLALLQHVEQNGFHSSVRDYHTQALLRQRGLTAFWVTGCPSLYPAPLPLPTLCIPSNCKPQRIVFSMGVTHRQSRNMRLLSEQLISTVRQQFHDSQLTVLFHHSLEPDIRRQAYGNAHQGSDDDIARWLDSQRIGYLDISGSAERMIETYRQADLHVGFRVHGHICAITAGLASILLTEDARGKALRQVIGGLTLDAVKDKKSIGRSHISFQLGQTRDLEPDLFVPNPDVVQELDQIFTHLKASPAHWQLFQIPIAAINHHWPVMEAFLKQLP